MKVQSTIDLVPGSRRQALRLALIGAYLERVIQIIETRRSRAVDRKSDLGYHLKAEGGKRKAEGRNFSPQPSPFSLHQE